ncbi:MAG: hypothetical protein WAV25_02670 [Minisyncoccia bacterium]
MLTKTKNYRQANYVVFLALVFTVNFLFVSTTFAVGSTQQTILFASIPDKIYGDSDFIINATSTDSVTGEPTGLPINFVLNQGPCSINLVSGSTTIHIIAASSTPCRLKANQEGNDTYAPIDNVNVSFLVSPKPITISVSNTENKIFGEPDPEFAYTGADSL